jgi:hypothetical protein
MPGMAVDQPIAGWIPGVPSFGYVCLRVFTLLTCISCTCSRSSGILSRYFLPTGYRGVYRSVTLAGQPRCGNVLLASPLESARSWRAVSRITLSGQNEADALSGILDASHSPSLFLFSLMLLHSRPYRRPSNISIIRCAGTQNIDVTRSCFR